MECAMSLILSLHLNFLNYVNAVMDLLMEKSVCVCVATITTTSPPAAAVKIIQ